MGAPRFEVGEIYDTDLFSALAISETQLLVFDADGSYTQVGECLTINQWDHCYSQQTMYMLRGAPFEVTKNCKGRAILKALYIGG